VRGLINERGGVAMTSQREGYCRVCGEYSQGVYIEYDRLCNACHTKMLKKDKPTIKKLQDWLEGTKTAKQKLNDRIGDHINHLWCE